MTKRYAVILLAAAAGVGLAFALFYAIPRLGALARTERMECTVIEGGVLPEDASPFPPVNKSDWQQGPADALVTMIVYGDYQCPYCAELHPALSQLQHDYPDDFRLVFRNFPLTSLYDKAYLAALAAEAAGLQGHFWSMHDLLYTRQPEWKKLSESEFRNWLSSQAAVLGLDSTQFDADLESPALAAQIAQASEQAVEAGLSSTPSIVINGQYYEGVKDHWTLAAIIELVRLEQRQYTRCPPVVIDAKREYTAVLQTTKGTIHIALFPRDAPLAVNSFVFLAREGWYDGVPIFRVIPEFAMQTGDPSGTGSGGPGYEIRTELAQGSQFDRPGLVGMANDGVMNNGSQFFITYAPQEILDGAYTLIGEVVSGMDVATALTVRDPASNPENLPEADRILKVTVEEK